MAKVPDLREFGGEFLLCDKAGQTRVLIRPQPEHQPLLAERLGGHGFEWSEPHAGFVADRHLKFSDLAKIFPGVQLVDAAAVGKVQEAPARSSAQAWIAAQDDRTAARDIAFGDHEKLCLDVEHGRRQMTPERAKAMITSAQAAGVLCEQRSAYMTGRVESWMNAVRSSEMEVPAWHTPIPAEGLAPIANELKGDGYRWVASRLAREAMDAVTQVQLLGSITFQAYVRPADGANHGRIRFLPADQSAPGAPWFLLREEPFRLGFMPRENAIRQVADLLSNKPVIAVAPVPESAAPAPAM